MAQILNIKSNDVVSILFSNGSSADFVCNASWLPSSITAPLNSLCSYLASEGLSEVHMEKDTFRVFTHKILAGLVEHEDGISRPEFDIIHNLHSEISLAVEQHVMEEASFTEELITTE
jgi:hypothetical protein